MIIILMLNMIVPYLCFRLGMGTLPMLSLMAGELAVYALFGHIVVVPVPFGVGTNAFKEIYNFYKTIPASDEHSFAAEHGKAPQFAT
jgi:hypothetical protein